MNKHSIFFTLFVITPLFALGQDSLTVNKKKLDKLIKKEIKTMGSKYTKGYKEGRVTWTYPKKIARGEWVHIEIKFDGEGFYFCYYNPLTDQKGRCEDLR